MQHFFTPTALVKFLKVSSYFTQLGMNENYLQYFMRAARLSHEQNPVNGSEWHGARCTFALLRVQQQ